MKKWQTIADPKSGKITMIPPSILNLIWWEKAFYTIREAFYRLRVRLWNGGLLLWWYRLWIRKDEFHPSLDLDYELLTVLSRKDRDKYQAELLKRRQTAHQNGDPTLQAPRHQEIFKKAALIRKNFKIKSRYPHNGKTLDETIDEIIAENQ